MITDNPTSAYIALVNNTLINTLVVNTAIIHIIVNLVTINNIASDYTAWTSCSSASASAASVCAPCSTRTPVLEDNPIREDAELTNNKLSVEKDCCNYPVDILACNLGAEPRFSYS